MGGDELEAAGHAPERQRDAGGCCRGGGGGNSGHDMDGNAISAQMLHLLGGAAEDRWIAALQPNHAQTRAGCFQQQIIYAALILRMPARQPARKRAVEGKSVSVSVDLGGR